MIQVATLRNEIIAPTALHKHEITLYIQITISLIDFKRFILNYSLTGWNSSYLENSLRRATK